MIPQRVTERVLSNVAAGPDGCVVSTYSTGSHGYAQVGWKDGGRRMATVCHRVAYEAAHGPIPDDMTVDHVCRNRRCVNPRHLRLLSNRVNATLNGNALKAECPQGHLYDEANTILRRQRSGRLHRWCRRCQEETNAAKRAARRSSARSTDQTTTY